MPHYLSRGTIPPKRHTQFRSSSGQLYYEELISRKGFSSAYSNAYHIHMPSRTVELGPLTPWDITQAADVPRPRHLQTADLASSGNFLSARKLLLYNDDVAISKAHCTENIEHFYRQGHSDELIFIQSGQGQLVSNLGQLSYGPGDYLVVPRGLIWQLRIDQPTRCLVISTRGAIEPPDRYCNEYGQLLEHAPFCERDIRLPEFVDPVDQAGKFSVQVSLDDGMQEYVYGQHPYDIVGWDGTVYPWAFNINNFEPITGRIHQPPPVHQNFQAPGVVVCSFVPRKFDYHPDSIPAPYYHSNVDSDEVLFYSKGQFMSRTGIEEESITIHPMGLPHGPQPGKYEGSIGEDFTDELAVMIDTFKPLRVASLALEIDDPDYPDSWNQ